MFGVYFAILALAANEVAAGYTDNSGKSGNELGNGGSNPDGYGYGYSGSFSGSGPPPNFAFPQFDFSGFLGNYLESLNRYHQEFLKKGGGAFSYSHASASPTANAKAQSSLTFKRKGNNRLQANTVGAAQAGGYGQPGGFSGGYGGGSFGNGNGGAFGGSFSGSDGGNFGFPSQQGSTSYRGSFGPSQGGAAATASFGPGGIQQTAEVYPENPNSPNVNTRFGGSSSDGTGDGFHSVFTSSQSHTSNVDGKPVTVQRATTTVNDNGRITTYTAKNP